MPKRGENIRKRKDGRWEARYKKGVDNSGKTQYGSIYGKTYREAKAKQQEKFYSLKTQAPIYKDSLLFQDAAKLWLEDNRIHVKGATECRYRNLLESHIIPDLGNIRLSQITGTRVNAYLADKMDHGRLDGKGGLSASYVRSMMLIINSVMAFSASNLMCAPLQTKICKPPVVTQELLILTPEEQKRLEHLCMAQVDATKLGILLSLYAGLRIGEVCALEWSDIDLQEQLIHVRKTISRVHSTPSDREKSSTLIIERPKTPSSYRDIPLCSWLVPIVEEYQNNARSAYVVSTSPSFVSPRTYDYRYHRILSIAGVRSINYHALRHTFATRCIEAGVDVKSLSEMLGHADASVTLNTYVHSSIERKRLQLESLRP